MALCLLSLDIAVFSFSSHKFFQNCRILSFLCAGHPGLPL